jgi:hypothetical protein
MLGVLSGRRALAAVAAGVAVGIATPGAARAITPLPTGAAVINIAGPETYSVTTRYPYWSVVATSGLRGSDSDITLTDPGRDYLNSSSTDDAGGHQVTDWVAVDNNAARRPVGSYFVDMTAHPGDTTSPMYKLLGQFVEGSRALSTSSPGVDQPIGFAGARWLVDIRDIYLTAGATVTLDAPSSIGAIHLLDSDAANSSTWTRTRASSLATARIPGTARRGRLTSRVPRTGRYGVVFEPRHRSGATSVRVTVSPA